MALLGSRFVAHPSNTSFEVRVTDVDHPLTAGIDDFEVHDEEPYYCEPIGAQTVLLEATYNQPSAGYVQSDYGTDRESQPQMYLHPYGGGRGAVSVFRSLHRQARYETDGGHCARRAWVLE